MKTIIIIYNIILFSYALYHLIRTIIFINKTHINVTNSINKNTKIIILIPCLEEQKIIKDTIKHFDKIINNNPNFSINLITTEKEIKKDNNDTTYEYIKKNIIGKYNNINLIHYPYKEGYMADQLNYAIKEINSNKTINKDNTYICVYNADSYPSKNTFNEVLNQINTHNNPLILQQYSYSFLNIDSLNIILKGFAIYQSNFELKMGLLNSYFDNKLHKHILGHGLFVRLDYINKINGFNTKYWCEDIYLSMYLEQENTKIIPLLTLENMETANSISNLTKQNAVWFNTSSKCISIYKEIKKSTKKRTISSIIGLINEIRSFINWLFFPILLLFIIISSILINSYNLTIITIFNYLIYIYIYYITTIKIINHLDNKQYKFNIKIYLGTIIATFISNIGPLYSIIVSPKEKHKTER